MITVNMIKRFQFTLKSKRQVHNLLKQSCHYHRVSQVFQPLNVHSETAVVKKAKVSLSQKLLLECGIVRAQSLGMHVFLPLGLRVLMKLSTLIDEEMERVGAQKLLLPTLTSSRLWKQTGRWTTMGEELMKCKDRHEKEFVISPTHEEAIVEFLAEVFPVVTYRQLPLRLYQISNKFRDEMNPRFGLLRCKEFLMKDLYTFDEDETSSVATYNQISKAYDSIFQRLEVPFIKVAGHCGDIGGNFSHEYHYPAAIGQDTLLICRNCGDAMNEALVEDPNAEICIKCGGDMQATKGIEVGHTFLLGTKYTKPLNCCYVAEKGKPLMHMGCYGIGISRLLAAAVEVLSSENSIRWPRLIAPYKVYLVGPKRGSKESNVASWIDNLANAIDSLPNYQGDVIVDDRNKFTIGKRVLEAKRIGYPTIIVVGKKANETEPLFEVIDTINGSTHFFSHMQLFSYLESRC